MKDLKLLVREKLMLMTIVCEQLTKCYKTALFNEFIIDDKEKLKRTDFSNNKEKYSYQKHYADRIKEHEKSILRSEKYNSEVTKAFEKVNPGYDTKDFIDKMHDFFYDITNLLFKHTEKASKDNKLEVYAAILVSHPDGEIVIDGKRFKLHSDMKTNKYVTMDINGENICSGDYFAFKYKTTGKKSVILIGSFVYDYDELRYKIEVRDNNEYKTIDYSPRVSNIKKIDFEKGEQMLFQLNQKINE